MINREIKAYKTMLHALETIFLALVGLFLIYRVSRSTMFRLNWPSHIESLLMWGMIGVASVRLLMLGLHRWETIGAIVFTMVYVAVYRVSGFSFLLFLAIFTVGFLGIDYRKILRMYLLTVGVFYAVTLLAGMTGIITNFVSASSGRGVRSAWGMSYYTDFASLGLFIMMWIWVTCRRVPYWVILILCTAFLLLSIFIARSNTSTLCALLLFCAVLYPGIEQRFIDKNPKLFRIKKWPDLFAMFGFLIFASIMFAMMLSYARGTNIGYRLDNILSARLRLAVSAWKNHGLKPFGTPFDQNGSGFSTFPSNAYNFVDSSYPLILLRYGWVTFLVLCLSWGMTAKRVSSIADRRLLLVMGIIAVHSFAEHHFIDSHFNIMVTMPLAAFETVVPECVDADRAKQAHKTRALTAAWTITGTLVIIAIYFGAPMLLSKLKTVLELLHYGHGNHALRTVAVMAAVLSGVSFVAWAMGNILKTVFLKADLRSCLPATVILSLCAIAGTVAWVYTDRIIDDAAKQYAPLIESDRRALNTAVASATGKVYSGVLPSLYTREIEGISYAAFFEDDMSRLHGDTVLMSADTERGAFIKNGFLYVPISEAHALYTADRSVVEALVEAGYRCTGYYSGTREIDLIEAAALNGLDYDPTTGLRLSGAAGVMGQGPWQDLYGGRYTVTWSLALPEGMDRSADKLCTLRVTTYKGDTVILEKKVEAEKFDADGQLDFSMSFKIRDSRNVAFEAWTEDGVSVDIKRISYARTPNNDIHAFYDAKLKKIRDEYYDSDNMPTLCKEGWFACDYAYDRYGNINRIRYYDCNGAPVLAKGGYAERRRTFNARRQILREAYFGTDGQPVVNGQGYAVSDREYDGAGNAIVRRYYGTDNQPVIIKAGYAEVHRVFNSKKKVIRESYYGVNGEPIALNDGYAAIDREYDEDGNVTVQRYYGVDGAPVVITSGYARVDRVFNNKKQVVREIYFGADEQPIQLHRGHYGLELDYDEAGNVSMRRYLDAKGQPKLNVNGYAEVRYEYNEKKKKTWERFYRVDGQPIENKKGYWAVQYEYNIAGKIGKKRYYDCNGTLIKEKTYG